MMKSGPLILLATHNGDRFLEEQLDSIIAQTSQNWSLLISDDGSTDRTLEIINRYVRADSRIQMLPAATERLGSTGNFSRLLEAGLETSAELFMFCDQDDTWRADKISLSLDALRAASASPEEPLLVHSDLEVFRERDGRPLGSFMQHMHIRHRESRALETLCIENFVTGSTTLFNRALARLVAPVPGICIQHDWWLALVAASSGRILYVPDRLVTYRQHDRNVFGAQRIRFSFARFLAKPSDEFTRRETRFIQSILQARHTAERLRTAGRLRPHSMQVLCFYAGVLDESPLLRYRKMVNTGIVPSGLLNRLIKFFVTSFARRRRLSELDE